MILEILNKFLCSIRQAAGGWQGLLGHDEQTTQDAMLSGSEAPVAAIRYLYATKDSILFQPVFVRLRADKSADDCVLSQLVYTDRAVVTEP